MLELHGVVPYPDDGRLTTDQRRLSTDLLAENLLNGAN